MSRRNCRKLNPTTMREALDACKNHALTEHNRGIERVAELSGEESHWTVYGWLRDGSIPGKKILAYQHACGCDYITRYLAHADGKLLIDIPPGRAIHADDVHQLQAHLNTAVGALLGFASGRLDADQVGAEISNALEALAWHRENAARFRQPELDLNNHE